MSTEPALNATTEDSAEQDQRPGMLPQPYLFVVMHCDRPLSGGARYALSEIDLVTLGRGPERTATRRRAGASGQIDLRFPGNTVSSMHARIVRVGDGFGLEDAQSRNGSFLNGERVTGSALRDGDLIGIGPVLLRYRAALPASPSAPPDLDTATLNPPAPGFATLLPHLTEQLAALERIARLPVSVLLLGESGTGKEVLARAVHTLSQRPGPFVAVNCGGLPASLLESLLFGHTKGSFTGATETPGLIRSADRGTLFLDEIGDMPLPAQAALLRVLQEREVVPVGGTKPIKVDVRVVSATHKPLEQMAARGEFRHDFLARLSGYRHALPPLRGRIEDLGLLLGDLLRRSELAEASSLRLSPAAGREILKHTWPLNIRELQHLLSTAPARVTDGILQPEDVREALFSALNGRVSEAKPEPADLETLRAHLFALLEKHQGNVSYVARDMGKARQQIHRWMKRLGIDPNQFRAGYRAPER